jgi:hypothetical protein
LIGTEATTGDIKTATEALAALISAGALSVSLGELPDTAGGDMASMSADLGTIQADLGTVQADIALMKADLALVNCKTYEGQDRTTTTGAAEELTIPAGSKRAIISCAPSSQAYIEINGDASTSSPLYLEDPFGPLILDLGGVTKLSAYVVAGNLGAVFFG